MAHIQVVSPLHQLPVRRIWSLLLLLSLAGNNITAAENPPLAIDLNRLEPQVAKQLEAVQAILLEVTARPDSTPLQRAEAYGEFGRLLHAYGYTTEAAECYRHSVADQHEDARWWHLLGCALEASGKLPDAEAAFRTALKYRDSTATRIRLANVLAQQNQRDEARRIFSELLAMDSKLPAAQAGAGALALEARDFQKAIEHLSLALELVPAATRLHYSLAMAYRGAGNLEQARQHLRLRGDVGIRPDDPLMDELPKLLKGAQVHLMRGKIALAAGAVADAIHEYQLAVDASPDNVAAHVNLAVALVRMKRYDEAVEHLQYVVQHEPGNTSALFNLASLRQTQGQHTAAIELLRKLLEIEPRDVAAHLLLAQSLTADNQTPQALQVLRAASKIVPDDEPTLLQLVDVLSRQGEFKEGITRLDAAVTKHPDRGLTLHALARLLASCPDSQLRDGPRALRLAESVYRSRQTFNHTETLAMALAAVDRFDEAIQLQKQLLSAAEQQRVEPVVTRIKQNLARYEQHETAR